MTLPLALTLGEPAGIGPDLTLAIWSKRRALAAPSFYLLGDPDFLRARAPAPRLSQPHRGAPASHERVGVRPRPAGRAVRPPSDCARRPSRPQQRAGCDRRD